MATKVAASDQDTTRKAWAEWLNTQRARSGGKIIRWAQRRGVEEGYIGLRPEKRRRSDNKHTAGERGGRMGEAVGK